MSMTLLYSLQVPSTTTVYMKPASNERSLYIQIKSLQVPNISNEAIL